MRFVSLLLLAALAVASLRAEVVAHTLPAEYPLSDRATIHVNGTTVPLLAHNALYDYCHFSANGPLEITITAREDIRSWSISPLALNLPAKVSGSTLTFSLPRATYLLVKINGGREIALAADPAERDAPAPDAANARNVQAAPYSADATGRTLVTGALQRAIDDVHAAGGGTVYLPPGVYLASNLTLRSHVSLYLAGGAVLKSSGNPKDFTTYYHKNSLGMDGTWFIQTEPNSTDIRIFGRGTIDGNARELRTKNHYLNNLVVPLQTSRFTIEGVVLADSGLWGLIPTRSDHVVIRDTKHFNEVDQLFEDDAVDIIESQHVLVSRVFAISEDDTFSTKTWDESTDIAKHWPGSPEPLEDVIFEDCLAWSRCATYKVGFGNFQPQRHITFRRSTAYRSMRAVALNRFWGSAPTEDVTFEDIDVEGFQSRERDLAKSRWLDINTGSAGPVKRTLLRNITVRDVGPNPSRIEGFNADNQIEGLKMENVVVNGKAATSLADLHVGVTNAFVTGLSFTNGN